MPEEYSWEIREAAKELYVVDGQTYDQVASATGVSISQLKRWGTTEDWTGAKKEYREALSSIRRDTVRLRAKLLKTALDTGDPQSVYAFAAIEKATAAVGKKTGSDPEPAPAGWETMRAINTPEDAVAALKQVVELKLNKLLACPETLQLSQIRDLKQTMEVIDQMKQKYAPEKGEDKTLDAQSIRDIREMLKL